MNNNKIIIVEGYLAAGKSTFVKQMSKALNIPNFIKDTFKIALSANFPVSCKEDSNRFSAITFDAIMYVAERFMEAGHPLIIEGNFVPAGMKKVDEASVIRELIEKYSYQSLTFKFVGDSHVLYKRYSDRNNLPERGDANKDYIEVTFDMYDGYCRSLEAFNVGGQVIKVDTTDFEKIDFNYYIEKARLFLE